MNQSRGQRGFSLVELLVVVAIIMVIAAVATPSVVNGIASSRLQAAATDTGGLLQRMRGMAVRDNTFYRVACPSLASSPHCTSLWIDSNNNGSFDAGEYVINFANGVTLATPSGLSGLTVGGQTPVVGLAGFDSRGMPCTYDSSSGRCDQSSGSPTYVFYFTTSQGFNAAQWMAVTIASGGRVQVWRYDLGSSKWGTV